MQVLKKRCKIFRSLFWRYQVEPVIDKVETIKKAKTPTNVAKLYNV